MWMWYFVNAVEKVPEMLMPSENVSAVSQVIILKAKGACTYDVCKIFGNFVPLPPVCILEQFIVLNSRNLPY